MPELAKLNLQLDQLEERVDSLFAGIEISPRQIRAGSLAEISTQLGLIRSGEFRSGNEANPGDGFTGVRIGYPGFTYGGEIWNLVGVNNDVLQVGFRATDGKLIAGGGLVTFDADGITFLEDGLGGVGATVKWRGDSDEDIFSIVGYDNAPAGHAYGRLEVNKESDYATRSHLTLAVETGGHVQYISLIDDINTGPNLEISMGSWITFNANENVFNEGGIDVDFRVEAVGQANAIFVQGSSGRVGIGTATPAELLHVSGGNILLDNTKQIRIRDAGGTENNVLTLTSDVHTDELILGAGSGIDNLSLATGGTRRLFIDNSGNVGIGTATPTAKLHIQGASNQSFTVEAIGASNSATMALKAGNNNQSAFAMSDSDAVKGQIVYDHSDDSLKFLVNGIETIRVISNLNVGIGTSTPGARLHVVGRADDQQLIVQANDTQNQNIVEIWDDEDNVLDVVTPTGFRRGGTAFYRRYFHLTVGGFDPGASGATWINPDANTTGGWQLNAVGETLIAGTDIHADWDGISDIIVEITFDLNASGSPNDTVDLKLVAYYKGAGDTATKTQTVEVATVTDGTQYKTYKATFTLNYDETNNVIDVGDEITFILNLETDTSEIDDIIVTDGSFYYNTTHLGIESGDV